MIAYTILKTIHSDILELSETMRKADIEEVWAAAKRDPLTALEFSWKMSPETYTARANGKVMCIYGVAHPTLLSSQGVPWMLGSDILPYHAKEFLRGSKEYIKYISEKYKVLANVVDQRNTDAIRWLKWAGFDVQDPVEFGPFKMPFRPFIMEK